MKPSVGKALVGASLATGLAVGSAYGNIAGAHTRDSGDVRLVSLPTSAGCVDVRDEMKHNGNNMRIFGKVRSYKAQSGGSFCNQHQSLQLRLKLQTIRRSSSGGAYTLCSSSTGDGRGEPGYVHTDGTGWEMGRVATYNGQEYFPYLCGTGTYRGSTWGHAYNDSWRGGQVQSPAHNFPTK